MALALLAIATNVATGSVLPDWGWLKNGPLMWSLVGALVVATVVLAVWAARPSASSPGDPSESGVVASGGSAVSTGGPAVGSVVASAGSIVVVGDGGSVTMPVPPLPPPARPGRVVVGELPGAPLAFQDRGILAQIRSAVEAGGRVVAVCSMVGGRGVGKTQAAAAYARARVLMGCPLVAWVSGENRQVLLEGLAEVAREVGVADPEGDAQRSARRLRTYLETTTAAAVLVLDNVEIDVEALRPLLPVVGGAEVIVTSTHRDAISMLGPTVDVSVFDRGQSLTYLAERTGIGAEQQVDADALATEMGDLPLALAHAASVIKMERLSYRRYLDRLRALPLDRVLTRPAGDAYPRGVAEAIVLSVHAIIGHDSLGRDEEVLNRVAVLSPDGTSRDLLTSMISAEARDADSDAEIDATLARLAGASLLIWGEDGDSVIMHRLVGRVLRDRMQAAGRWGPALVGAAKAVQSVLVGNDDTSWEQRDRSGLLVGHVGALLSHAAGSAGTALDQEVGQAVVTLANRSVNWLIEVQNLSTAVGLGERVIDVACRVLGEDHPDTLRSCSSLANAYWWAGQLDRSIALYEAILTDHRRILGEDHPDTLRSRSDLADAYWWAGQLDRAIALYEAILTDRRRVLSEDHPDTLRSRSDLADAYRDAGQHDRAIALYEAILTDRRRVLSEDHPDTLRSRSSLANAYWWAGQLDRAIALYEAILTDRRRVLGEDHPDTLSTRSDLADAYRRARQHDRAIALYEAILTDRRRVLGEDHPDTLRSRNSLAFTYQLAGQLDRAIALYEISLADRRRVLGDDHPDTLRTRSDLADAYSQAGQHDRAIALYEATLTDHRRVLGDDHPDTLRTRNSLAFAYREAGQHDRAIALYEATLAECRRALGDAHPLTRTVRVDLANARGSS